MALDYTITHADDSTEVLDGVVAEITHEFEKVDVASLYATRSAINDVSLVEGEDEIVATNDGTTVFAGILRDVRRGGSAPELVVESYERLALDAERTSGGDRWVNVADDEIVQDAIDTIPGLSAGTVDTLEASTTFVFSYASPAKKIRTVAEALGGEVRYNPDGTVDYLANRGTDKTATTISPSEQNISGSLNPERGGSTNRVTHLVMVGAGEGESQITATIVPDPDPYDYENDDDYANVRRYTPTGWSAGDRKVWDARSNKDVTDGGTLADQGERLIEEFEVRLIEVEVTVKDETVNLGDEFTIVHPLEGIDEELRAVEVMHVIDDGGVRYECVFSNRRLARQADADKEAKDLDRYNMAFEGSSFAINVAGGRQPVGLPPLPNPADGGGLGPRYQMGVYYPDEVQYEHRLNVRVVGLPYRAYSYGGAEGGAHDHDVEIDNITEDNTDYGVVEETFFSAQSESLDDTWFTFNSWTPSNSMSELYVTSNVETTSDAVVYWIRVEDETAGEFIPRSDGIWQIMSSGENDAITIPVPGDRSGNTLNIQMQLAPADAPSTLALASTWYSIGPHQHDIDVVETSEFDDNHTHDVYPGVIENFAHLEIGQPVFYPANCDVSINGSSLGTSFGDGSGQFEETVDIAGELTQGAFNEITVSSESLGHLQVYVEGDVYRQILGNG